MSIFIFASPIHNNVENTALENFREDFLFDHIKKVHKELNFTTREYSGKRVLS